MQVFNFSCRKNKWIIQLVDTENRKKNTLLCKIMKRECLPENDLKYRSNYIILFWNMCTHVIFFIKHGRIITQQQYIRAWVDLLSHIVVIKYVKTRTPVPLSTLLPLFFGSFVPKKVEPHSFTAPVKCF